MATGHGQPAACPAIWLILDETNPNFAIFICMLLLCVRSTQKLLANLFTTSFASCQRVQKVEKHWGGREGGELAARKVISHQVTTMPRSQRHIEAPPALIYSVSISAFAFALCNSIASPDWTPHEAECAANTILTGCKVWIAYHIIQLQLVIKVTMRSLYYISNAFRMQNKNKLGNYF